MLHVIAQDSTVAAGSSQRYSFAGPFVDSVIIRHTTGGAANADPNERIEYLFVSARIVGPNRVIHLLNRVPAVVLAAISDYDHGENLLASQTTGDHCFSVDHGHIALLPGEEYELIVYNESADVEATGIIIDAAVVHGQQGPTVIRSMVESMDTQFSIGDCEQIWVYDFTQNATTKRVTLNSVVDQNAEVKVRTGAQTDAFALEFAELMARIYGNAEKLKGTIALVHDAQSHVGIPLTVQYSIVGTATGQFRALAIVVEDEPVGQTVKRAGAELAHIRQVVASVPAAKVAGLVQRQLIPTTIAPARS